MGDADSMVRAAREGWDALDWRYHGIGLMQAYLPGTDRWRLHVWHRELAKPGIEDSGALHNHRFRLRSTILFGALVQELLHVEDDPNGWYQLWELVRQPERDKSELTPRRRVSMNPSDIQVVTVGQTYEMEKWHYHHAHQVSVDHDVTITLVEISDKGGGNPHIIAPYGSEPVHAFDGSNRASREVVATVLDIARSRMDYVCRQRVTQSQVVSRG